jgi:methionine-rich copper-binding protein CopC
MAYIWIRNVMRSSRTIWRVGVTIAALIVGGLPLGTLHAETGSMDLVRSYPKPNDVVDGSMVSVHLCFEAPVDHERSTLTLRSREAVRPLRPRLEAATDCLFSIVGRLAPDEYDLGWEARLSGGQTDSGTIPFTVRSSQAKASDERVSRVESDGYKLRPNRNRATDRD